MANLHFFYGTMGAAKSTKLIQDRYNFLQKHEAVLVIKPETDRTKEAKIVSRIGLECPAVIMKEIKFGEQIPKVIMIDEVQFFTPSDIDYLVKFADNSDKLIFCYGLMVDINEHIFPALQRLIEIGAKLHELPCSCQMVGCMNLASHHLRYDKNNKVIKNGKSVDVDDGHVTYKSVCRKCYNKAMGKER